MGVRWKRIDEVVTRLLEDQQILEPPVDVEAIAEELGIQVQLANFDDDDVSGFLYRENNQAVIGVNKGHSRTRRRFTIGHEIGHYLLHNAGFDEVHVDHIRLRNKKSSEGTDSDEVEANAFAAQLLMPASFLMRDLAEIEIVDVDDEQLVTEFAKKYGVSAQAMSIRLNNLGYMK